MSHPATLSPHRPGTADGPEISMRRSKWLTNFVDVSTSGKFVHDAKDDLEEPSMDSPPTSHPHPHASHHHGTPDFESESDEELIAPYATSDLHSSAPNHTVSPVSPVPCGVLSPFRIACLHRASITTDSHCMSLISHADRVRVQAEPIPTGLDQTSPRVRFRSRVRISAGRRRRHSDGLLPSSASSVSGSPSSSISAPLRTHYTGNNGWGTLGMRVSNLSSSQTASHPPSPSRGEHVNGGKGSGGGERNAWRQWLPPHIFIDDAVDEHTHLMTSARPSSYLGNRYAHDSVHDDVERERQWREQLMDQVFGKWPARLLNRHVSRSCARMTVSCSWFFAMSVVVVASGTHLMLSVLPRRRGMMYL